MRISKARGLWTALAAFGVFLLTALPTAGQSVQITLLHINDTHSHLAAWGPKGPGLEGTLGGIAKAAAIVAAEKAFDPDALFVHSGDFIDGDVFFNEYLGVPELQLLKMIGLDALVLGNHEFRFGPDFLAGILQAAWGVGGVPIVGTNLEIPEDNPLRPWVTSMLILEAHGVKVGLIGLTTPSGALASPDPVVILPDLEGIAQGAVTELRGAGAQVVVCLTHFGMSLARQVAGAVSGIDVIVNAHDHAVLEQPETVDGPDDWTTLIVSAGEHYRWVGRLRLLVGGGQVSLVDYALLGADESTPPLAEVQAAVEVLKAGIVARYGNIYYQPLAWAEQDITLDWDPNKAKRDTPLGNLLADAYRAWTGTDVAIEPFGYMGDVLPAGTIVGADVFRAMSYGNLKVVDGKQIARPWRLVTFRATGAALIGTLEVTLHFGGDYFPQVSGVRFDYDSRAKMGKKILLDKVHVGGHKLLMDQLYSVTVTEGVWAALKYGLKMPMQDEVTLPDWAFDAVRSLVAQRGVLGLATSNRIRDIAVILGRRSVEPSVLKSVAAPRSNGIRKIH